MKPMDIEAYIKYKLLNNMINSNNTTRAYRSKLLAWFRFIKLSPVLDVYDDADKYLNVLAARHDTAGVKSTLHVLKNFYDWLEIDPNPFSKLVKNYQIKKSEVGEKRLARDNKVLNKTEVFKMTSYARSLYMSINSQVDPVGYYLAYRNWFMIEMLSEYGMRINGLMGVDINHIDFDNRTMLIMDSKNGLPYPVPIKNRITIVKEYLIIRSGCMNPDQYQSALLLSKSGRRLSDTSARRAINEIALKVGIYRPDRSTHQMRHYRATEYYKNGMDTELISQIMGVSVPVLKKTYLHITDKDTVRQYENWLDCFGSGFLCHRCGYGDPIYDTRWTSDKKPKLKLIKS